MENWQTRSTLLEKVKNPHDDLSWEDFISYYQKYVLIIILNMDVNQADAEEIQQAVFLKLWKNLPDFSYDRSKGRFRSWISTLTRNEVRKFYRKMNSRNSTLDNYKESSKTLDDQFSETAEVDLKSEKEWKDFIVDCAWENIKSSLPEKERSCYEMMQKNIPHEETAEKLGLTSGSLYVYKKRLKSKLYKEVQRLIKSLE